MFPTESLGTTVRNSRLPSLSLVMLLCSQNLHVAYSATGSAPFRFLSYRHRKMFNYLIMHTLFAKCFYQDRRWNSRRQVWARHERIHIRDCLSQTKPTQKFGVWRSVKECIENCKQSKKSLSKIGQRKSLNNLILKSDSLFDHFSLLTESGVEIQGGDVCVRHERI